MKKFRYLTEKNFSARAKKLRQEFTEVYKNPWHEKRFSWDYFFIPEQYRMMRTWADEFFSPEVYNAFQNELLKFGSEQFGCDGITRPWISFYVDGSYQNFHADVPHGPLAFVYSLTPSQSKFTGGETLLFKDELLDYWKNFEKMFGVETKTLMDKISPKFNQLLVFDPKIPHGVQEVRGTHDPLEGRLVIHGWFTNPVPRLLGARTDKKTIQQLNLAIQELTPLFEEYSALNGFLSLKFEITAKGKVQNLNVLVNTLVSTEEGVSLQTFLKMLQSYFLTLNFGPLLKKKARKTATKTLVTLPLLFQSN